MASGKFWSLLNQTSSNVKIPLRWGVLHIACYKTQRCIDFVGNDGMMSSLMNLKVCSLVPYPTNKHCLLCSFVHGKFLSMARGPWNVGETQHSLSSHPLRVAIAVPFLEFGCRFTMSMRRFGVPLWILRSRFKCRAFFSARVTHPNLCKTINIYIYIYFLIVW